MLYNFVDTVEHTSQSILPAEAMQFNGEYIENLIQGYRTLYVKGRDVLSPEVDTGEVGVRDGAYLKNRRFPARIITVGYQLLASNEEDFRAKFNALNDILNTEDAQLIFNDEDDKYFTGTPNGYSEVPEGLNNVTSEFEIMCVDPFKYSVEEYEVEPTEDDGNTFVVDYNGTYPAYPVIETDFYQSDEEDNTDGDCGYVAFVNNRGNVLQFGNVQEADEVATEVEHIIEDAPTTTTVKKNRRLSSDTFNGTTITTWNNEGYILNPSVNKRLGTLALQSIDAGGDICLSASNYGTSADGWHGPTGCKTIAAPPAMAGATNPTRSGDCKFWCYLKYATPVAEATAKKQMGSVQIFLTTSGGAYIAGVQVWKNKGSLKGRVRLYVRGHGAVKTWENVDLSHYNKYFGYKKPNAKTGANRCITIIKKSGKFSFNVGGLTFTYTDKTLANIVPAKISYFFGRWKSEPVVQYMGISSSYFDDTAVKYTVPANNVEYLTEIIDVQNTFSTNDKLIADCRDGTVWLQGKDDESTGGQSPELGALGNDWERFTLEKGENQIAIAYSDWVQDSYKPTFKLRYRERYL